MFGGTYHKDSCMLGCKLEPPYLWNPSNTASLTQHSENVLKLRCCNVEDLFVKFFEAQGNQ